MSEVETAVLDSAESAEGGADQAAQEGTQEGTAPQRQWYIVHTYSGYEERVEKTLKQRAEAHGMRDAFGEVKIPTETIVELKGGKKRETQRKFFPGYILVEIACEPRGDGRLKISDEAWHVVKNTPKVTGFVGTGNDPTPLAQAEVDAILQKVATAEEKPTPKYLFEKGELVKIVDGPFNNFTGTVEEINRERNTLKVMVTIFGRQTPVELEFLQVQKT